MARDKKGFIVYCDLLESLELLTMDQRGVLFTAILCDQNNIELPEMDSATRIAFSFVKRGIDLNTAKYNSIAEKRREAGKLGGRPKKTETEKQTKANESKKKQMKANQKQKNPITDNREQITDNREQITDNREQITEIDERESVIRHPFGINKNVMLSDDEMEALKKDFPEYVIRDKIEALSVYMSENGKEYKSHYQTLRTWIENDRDKWEAPEEQKPDNLDKLQKLENFYLNGGGSAT